jgi:hypothetical protein
MRKSLIVALWAGLVLALPMAAQASLIGQSISGAIVTRYGPVTTPFTATVGAGPEFSGNFLTFDGEQWDVTVDVGEASISIRFLDATYPTFGFLNFVHPDGGLPVAGIALTGFSDLGPMTLQSYSCPNLLACETPCCGPSILSLSSDNSSFDMSTDFIRSGETYVFGPGVPEPASWALMLSGLGLAGATLRGRRRARPQTWRQTEPPGA